MNPARPDPGQLARMREARRQTQHQLDLIERQIARRMSRFLASKRVRHPFPGVFMRRYRDSLAALTLERQPEVDVLSRKLARQDRAILALRRRHGLDHPVIAPYDLAA